MKAAKGVRAATSYINKNKNVENSVPKSPRAIWRVEKTTRDTNSVVFYNKYYSSDTSEGVKVIRVLGEKEKDFGSERGYELNCDRIANPNKLVTTTYAS